MVILCDFDDTVAEQNVAQLLLARFSTIDWQGLQRRFRNGEVTLKEYQEQAFRHLGQPRDALQWHVRDAATLRDGFVQLARYCRQNGVELAIVSHGLDFYVEALLRKYGLEDIPYYAVEANFTGDGMGYTYRYTALGCEAWGNCKCRILEGYRRQGHSVWYVGDGASDTCPAQRADLVFARGRLLSFCQERGIAHRELRDFHVVIDELRRGVHQPAAEVEA